MTKHPDCDCGCGNPADASPVPAALAVNVRPPQIFVVTKGWDMDRDHRICAALAGFDFQIVPHDRLGMIAFKDDAPAAPQGERCLGPPRCLWGPGGGHGLACEEFRAAPAPPHRADCGETDHSCPVTLYGHHKYGDTDKCFACGSARPAPPQGTARAPTTSPALKNVEGSPAAPYERGVGPSSPAPGEQSCETGPSPAAPAPPSRTLPAASGGNCAWCGVVVHRPNEHWEECEKHPARARVAALEAERLGLANEIARLQAEAAVMREALLSAWDHRCSDGVGGCLAISASGHEHALSGTAGRALSAELERLRKELAEVDAALELVGGRPGLKDKAAEVAAELAALRKVAGFARDVLYHDERGQGLGYGEAMKALGAALASLDEAAATRKEGTE